MRKNQNLNTKGCDPTQSPLTVTCTVDFDVYRAMPAELMLQWLDSLPGDAVVKLDNVYHGRAKFVATWTEQR